MQHSMQNLSMSWVPHPLAGHKVTSPQDETSLELVVEKQRGVSSLKALCLVAAERGLGLGARQVQVSPNLRKVWPSAKFFVAAFSAF